MKRLKEIFARFSKRLRGFTLLEILLVVTILTIIVAMAIPTLRTTKGGAYEMGAAKALRTLGEAEMAYRAVYGHYTSFEGLRQLNFINRDWRKYNPSGDLNRMAKHYSIAFYVKDTYRHWTFGYLYIAHPDANLPLDTYIVEEDGTIKVLRDGRLQPR
jgi:prepilin-type N-terminal cleavage/methylation domain-containing protein